MSCNPSRLARDLWVRGRVPEVEVMPMDMFSHMYMWMYSVT
ncbi:hypothetical protein [Paenibacillus sp. SSG-1]|nr:hypothetical protein [Paenibacillus sp. SSG-1]